LNYLKIKFKSHSNELFKHIQWTEKYSNHFLNSQRPRRKNTGQNQWDRKVPYNRTKRTIVQENSSLPLGQNNFQGFSALI